MKHSNTITVHDIMKNTWGLANCWNCSDQFGWLSEISLDLKLISFCDKKRSEFSGTCISNHQTKKEEENNQPKHHTFRDINKIMKRKTTKERRDRDRVTAKTKTSQRKMERKPKLICSRSLPNSPKRTKELN